MVSGAMGAVAVVASVLGWGVVGVGQSAGTDGFHAILDDLLDRQVRDGLVYYRALGAERARLDQYVDRLDAPDTRSAYPTWDVDTRAAFWLNAYNAIVLRTVLDHYPIRGTAAEYPPSSIRQIPGAFEGRRHRVLGESVTLDEIETDRLREFNDARLYLGLGRGAMGSPRLRSEAFTGPRLQGQLDAIVAECPTRRTCVQVDALQNRLLVTAVVGWREAEFVATFAGAPGRFATRSPVERAVIALIEPHLFRTELEFLDRNEFTVEYDAFDWTLNDLTGR